MGELLKEIRERNRRWRECPRHHFEVPPDGYRFGDKHTCTVCGVAARLHEIGDYIRGYVAAGGKGTDILADWDEGR